MEALRRRPLAGQILLVIIEIRRDEARIAFSGRHPVMAVMHTIGLGALEQRQMHHARLAKPKGVEQISQHQRIAADLAFRSPARYQACFLLQGREDDMGDGSGLGDGLLCTLGIEQIHRDPLGLARLLRLATRQSDSPPVRILEIDIEGGPADNAKRTRDENGSTRRSRHAFLLQIILRNFPLAGH